MKERGYNIRKITSIGGVMKPLKFIASAAALAAVVVASSITLSGCDLFDSSEQKEFKKFTPEIVGQYKSFKWNEVDKASSYDVYKNGVLVETVTSNIYNVGDEFTEDSTYYIVAHSDELKRNTAKSNEVVYYKNTGFGADETIVVKSASSVSISNNIRNVVFNEYNGGVTLDIADRKADLIVTLKKSTLTAGLDFTVDSDKTPFTAVIVLDGDSSITGKHGKSYTAADKGGMNSETDGKPGGNGQTALKAGNLVIKGDGNLTLTGGNGGNASQGSDSSGWTTKSCGKGASGGNGGNGLSCSSLTLDIGENNKLKAVGGAAGKKSSPGSNGSMISGPIISAAWYNWDIGKDGNAGDATSVNTRIILSGEIV